MDIGEETHYKVYIMVKQSADENTVYRFNISLFFGMWKRLCPRCFTSWKAYAYKGYSKHKCSIEEATVSFFDGGRYAKAFFSDFQRGWVGFIISNELDEKVFIVKNAIAVSTSRDIENIRLFLYDPFQSPGNSDV